MSGTKSLLLSLVYTLGGEFFRGGVNNFDERDRLVVTPCVGLWEEV